MIRRGNNMRQFLLLILMLAAAGWGTSRTAGGVHPDSVQAKIDLSSNGDTGVIPAGTGRRKEPVFDTTGIYMVGSGVSSTIIIDSTSDGVFTFKGDSIDKNFGLSYLTIKYGDDAFARISVNGTCRSWRIHHINVDSTSTRTIFITGYTYGLIDSCTFNINHSTDCIYF